jgi:hypothetical protein
MVRIINVEPDDEDNKGFLSDSVGKRPIIAAFHMPGCMYCEMLKQPWSEFSKMIENKYPGDETIVAFVHKDMQDDISSKVKGNLMIQGYPTIVGIKKGGGFTEFSSDRTADKLMKFYKKICGGVRKRKSKKNNINKKKNTMKGGNPDFFNKFKNDFKSTMIRSGLYGSRLNVSPETSPVNLSGTKRKRSPNSIKKSKDQQTTKKRKYSAGSRSSKSSTSSISTAKDIADLLKKQREQFSKILNNMRREKEEKEQNNKVPDSVVINNQEVISPLSEPETLNSKPKSKSNNSKPKANKSKDNRKKKHF